MADTKTATVTTGLSLPTVLFLIFLVLELTGTIDWPWYAVAAPLLIAWGFGFLIVLFFLFIAMIGDR